MQQLGEAELQRALQKHPGLIPVGINAARQELQWLDVGQFHFYEGFFHRSLNLHTGLRQKLSAPAAAFTTALSVLDGDAVLTDNLAPTAFIFHAGRCGSTLLVKALAGLRAHVVFGEAAPHDAIWEVLTNDWRVAVTPDSTNLRRYRNLILAMGRRRIAAQRAHFIKFTSFNILLFDFIRQAFPQVPQVFLYREPGATLASYRQAQTGWQQPELAEARRLLTGTSVATPEDVLTDFYTAALHGGLRLLNYALLTPGVLPQLLRAWRVKITPEELSRMQVPFRYEAKADYGAHVYLQARRQGIELYRDARLKSLYHQLAHSPLNF